ncbi:DNA-binding protein, partial [Croceibacterium mercuriale]
LGGVYPALFNFNLEDGQHPYPAGKYRVHSSSFKINNFGQVSVGRVLLESVKSA